MMASLIKTDGSVEQVLPKGNAFTLEELYGLLSCSMVEILPMGGIWLVVDEEGWQNRKEPNKLASQGAGQLLVGDVLVCEGAEIE